jgi:hypothetical protein
MARGSAATTVLACNWELCPSKSAIRRCRNSPTSLPLAHLPLLSQLSRLGRMGQGTGTWPKITTPPLTPRLYIVRLAFCYRSSISYLFTPVYVFFAVLVVVLFSSITLMIRSITNRRRQRRLFEDQIYHGTWYHGSDVGVADSGSFDLEVPKMWEGFIRRTVGSTGPACAVADWHWDSIKPLSVTTANKISSSKTATSNANMITRRYLGAADVPPPLEFNMGSSNKMGDVSRVSPTTEPQPEKGCCCYLDCYAFKISVFTSIIGFSATSNHFFVWVAPNFCDATNGPSTSIIVISPTYQSTSRRCNRTPCLP